MVETRSAIAVQGVQLQVTISSSVVVIVSDITCICGVWCIDKFRAFNCVTGHDPLICFLYLVMGDKPLIYHLVQLVSDMKI